MKKQLLEKDAEIASLKNKLQAIQKVSSSIHVFAAWTLLH